MSGAIHDLDTKGDHDQFLTGAPCRSFFIPDYFQHTDFATEVVEHGVSGSEEFGKTIRAEITGTGDLLSTMFLKVAIPEIRYTGTRQDRDSALFAWTTNLGHALIQDVTLLIGGREIVTHPGEWMNIYAQLQTSASQVRGLNEMVGNVPALTDTSQLDSDDSDLLKPAADLCIPLYFFTKDISKSIPLCALGTNRVSVSIKLRPIDQLCTRSDSVQVDNKLPLSASILAIHVTLTDVEAQQICCAPRKCLIDQVQTMGPVTISGDAQVFATDFSFPVRSLYWTIRNDNYYGGRFMAYDVNNWERARDNMARQLLLAEFDLDKYGFANKAIADAVQQKYIGQNGIEYEAFDPRGATEESGFVFDDSFTESQFDGTNFLGRLPEDSRLLSYEMKHKSLRSQVYDLRSKINGVIRVSSDPDNRQNIFLEVASITHNRLTIEDLSTNLSFYTTDNRNQFVTSRDVSVWLHDNTGIYIDGSVDPMSEASLSINGYARQISPSPKWFGPVEAYLHCVATPKPGVSTYHFEILAASSQPSGSSNFSAHTGAKIQVQRKMIPGITSTKDTFTMYANSYQILTVEQGRVNLVFKS